MSRITFWALNFTGFFLIIKRDPDEPWGMKTILGAALIAVGTMGIMSMHLLAYRKRKGAGEDAA